MRVLTSIKPVLGALKTIRIERNGAVYDQGIEPSPKRIGAVYGVDASVQQHLVVLGGNNRATNHENIVRAFRLQGLDQMRDQCLLVGGLILAIMLIYTDHRHDE